MRHFQFLALAASVAMAFGVSLGERIVLKSGQEIKAGILKQDSKTVVVDLGNTVVALNRADIEKIENDATQPGDVHLSEHATSAPVEKGGPAWQIYHVGKLTPATIEKNTERFGEAVVMVTSPAGLGSGFVISDDGYVVTNYHVIARETRLKVTIFHRTDNGFEQNNYKQVKIIAINPFCDLALLKIDAAGTTFKYLYMGDSTELAAGQECFAIGNPLGLTRSVSQGIVSTTNRDFEGQLYIQTTANIAPGNSGGPLFNLKGEVIGVTSMGYISFSGLNFAIPSDAVKRFIDNRDAFAYDEDNPNSGYRYLQPTTRADKSNPPPGRLPTAEHAKTN